MEKQRKLLENGKVEITTIEIVFRYEPKICESDSCFYDDLCNEFKDTYPMTVFHRDYSNLTCFEFGDADNDDTYSLEDYQKVLDDTFGKGKYEAYILGAYIHSGTSFSISKTGDNRCRWDSSNLGFIGIPVDEKNNIGKIADKLTNIWEGGYFEYAVYDNLEDAIVDSVVTADSYYNNEEIKKLEEKYNVSFEDVEM